MMDESCCVEKSLKLTQEILRLENQTHYNQNSSLQRISFKIAVKLHKTSNFLQLHRPLNITRETQLSHSAGSEGKLILE
jgi:hypothetical protein